MARISDSASRGSTLSSLDISVLELERQTWSSPARKDAAIVEALHISPARYYLRLAQLVDSAEALAFDPVLVRRLQRVMESRRVLRGSANGPVTGFHR